MPFLLSTGIPEVAREMNWSVLQLGCVYSVTEIMIIMRFSKNMIYYSKGLKINT